MKYLPILLSMAFLVLAPALFFVAAANGKPMEGGLLAVFLIILAICMAMEGERMMERQLIERCSRSA